MKKLSICILIIFMLCGCKSNFQKKELEDEDIIEESQENVSKSEDEYVTKFFMVKRTSKTVGEDGVERRGIEEQYEYVINENTFDAYVPGASYNHLSYEYNPSNNTVLYYELWGDEIVVWTKYIFDTNNNLIEENTYQADGTIISHKEYIYDSNNKLIKEICDSSYDKHYYIYNYDSYGNMIERILYSSDVLVERHEYIYELNKKVKNIMYHYDSEGNNDFRDETSYNSEGYTIDKIGYSSNNPPSGYHSEYAYDSSGYLIETEYYSYNNIVNDDYLHKFKYDKNGNRIEYIQYNKDGSIMSKIESTYDSNRNLLKSVYSHDNLKTIDEFEYKEYRIIKPIAEIIIL